MRRKKLAVGQLTETFDAAADAREDFRLVVPRRDFVVGDRPGNAHALFGVGFEVERTEAITLARPHERASADVIAAQPVERLFLDIRIVEIVDEPMLIGGRGITGARLHGFAMAGFLRDAVAVRQIPGIFGGGGIVGVPDHAPAFEHQRLQAFFGEFFCGPAAAHSGANDNRIK